MLCSFYLLKSLITFVLHCSGLLTGKFKKEENPDAKGSRIGILNKFGNLGTPMPLWESYKSNDSYWNLIDEMRTIAKTHGIICLSCMDTHPTFFLLFYTPVVFIILLSDRPSVCMSPLKLFHIPLRDFLKTRTICSP